MTEVLEAGEFPNLVRALTEGNLMDYDAEFEFGLQALARGYAEVAAKRIGTVPGGSIP